MNVYKNSSSRSLNGFFGPKIIETEIKAHAQPANYSNEMRILKNRHSEKKNSLFAWLLE